VGYSAGSLGASFHYNTTAEAFGEDVNVILVADAAAIFTDEYLTPCLQQMARDTWGLDEYIDPDCDGCIGNDGGGLVKMYDFMAKKYPDATFGLISATEDATMRMFYGYGLNDCEVLFPDYEGELYTDALLDLRDYFENLGFGGTYFYEGVDHGRLEMDELYTTEVDGTALLDWFMDILDGTTAHVGP